MSITPTLVSLWLLLAIADLIMNACEAIAECTDGRIGRITISTAVVGDHVHVEVGDNRGGMDPGTRLR